MLLYLVASLPSVSLDPRRVLSAAHWRSSCGLCSLWYVALLWFGGFLRVYVVRLVSAILLNIISIIILISCIIPRIICLLVLVIDVPGPIFVKNWLDPGEFTLFATKMRYHPPSAGGTGSLSSGRFFAVRLIFTSLLPCKMPGRMLSRGAATAASLAAIAAMTSSRWERFLDGA